MDNRLKSIVGGYYSSESGEEAGHQTTLRIVSGVNATTFQNAEATTKTFGIFTQNTFELTDQLAVTAGVRYSKDSRTLISRNFNGTNCLSLGVSLASIGGSANCVRPTSTSIGRFSYSGSVEYKPSSDILIYATTRHGFRSGGLQSTGGATNPAAADVAFTPYQAEIVTDYELGVKSEFFDRHLRVNVDVYRSNISGAIRSTPTPVPGTNLVATRLTNAAKIGVTGVEFDATALPIPGLELSVTGAYTDAKFKNYVLASGVDLSFLPVNFSPKWRVSLSGAYSTQTSFGSWRTQVDFSHEDRQLVVEQRAFVPAHDLVNARMTFVFANPDIEVAVFGKNLTDERYVVLPTDIPSLGFIFAGNYNAPRTWGVEVTKKF